MRIQPVVGSNSGHIARAPRFRHDGAAELETEGGTVTAQVRDISETGIAVSFVDHSRSPDMENGTFVELHVEGLGHVNGNVARTFDGGMAIHFERSSLDRQRVAQAVTRLYAS